MDGLSESIWMRVGSICVLYGSIQVAFGLVGGLCGLMWGGGEAIALSHEPINVLFKSMQLSTLALWPLSANIADGLKNGRKSVIVT